MVDPLMFHEVEYLNSSLAENSITGEPLVIITIRPDEGSYRPHNIGLSKTQAQRLLSDLKRLLVATPFLLLLFTAGCSARLEVTQEPPTAATSTVVAVDVLAKPDVQPEKPAVVNVAGDLHIHRHFHLHEEPTSEPVQVEVKRLGNDECRRLRLEHEARVARWKRDMGR